VGDDEHDHHDLVVLDPFSILLFLINVVHSWNHGEIAATPGKGNTLEWATTSPPRRTNFERVPPVAASCRCGTCAEAESWSTGAGNYPQLNPVAPQPLRQLHATSHRVAILVVFGRLGLERLFAGAIDRVAAQHPPARPTTPESRPGRSCSPEPGGTIHRRDRPRVNYRQATTFGR